MFPSSAASGRVPSHGQGNLLVEDQLMISFYSQQLFPNMSHEHLNSSTNPLLDQQPFSNCNCNCNNPSPTMHPQHAAVLYGDDDAISLGDQYCGGASSNCQKSLGNNIQWPWISTGEEAIDKNGRDSDVDVGSSINVEGLMVGNSVRTKKVVKGGGRRKMREPRFCFKTMSEGVDVLDDGYKWRKYGQKTVKDTHHPRSYYRCTRDKCRVKKRVERLAEDPRMVITTYEGRHIHSPPDTAVDVGDDVILQAASSRINFFR